MHDFHAHPLSPRRMVPAGGLAVLVLLTGCLAPRYRRPASPVPPAYKESAGAWKTVNPSDALPRGRWWELFGDQRLNELEAKVLVSNQNIKQAEAQYQEARALVAFNRAQYFPNITAQPSATRQYSPSGGPSGPRNYSDTFSLPVTASWEPDFWGQVRYATRASAAQAQASAAQLENVRLSLQAALAADYFTLAADDMEGVILSSAIASYDESLKLTEIRYQGGVASEVDVAQARSQLETTRAQATDLALSRAQLEHAIAVIVGEPPSTFSLSTSSIQGLPPPVPAGLPAQLLERRPDIASAERLAAAANASIGLARTAYFPTVSLSVTGGYESGAASFAQWLSWPSRVWALGASAAGTIFDFGRHRAQVRQSQAAYDAAVASYRQTVLSAFQEVEDELSALALLAQEAAQQDAAVKASEDALRLEMTRYKGGTVSYLDVIVTQNIALSNERTAAQILGRRMTAASSLILALGGGWNASKLPPGPK